MITHESTAWRNSHHTCSQAQHSTLSFLLCGHSTKAPFQARHSPQVPPEVEGGGEDRA